MKSDVWIVRVLLHYGRTLQLELLTEPRRAIVQTGLDDGSVFTGAFGNFSNPIAGALTLLPDGCIAEPVVKFDSEADAHVYREVLRRKHPAEDFRVILSAEPPA